MKSLFEYLNFIINGFSNLILLIKFNLRIFLMKGKKMIQKIKEILKYFLPPPVHTFNREVNRIIDTINRQNQNMELKLAKVVLITGTLKLTQSHAALYKSLALSLIE